MDSSANVLCDMHFTTIGGDISLSRYVAAFIRELDRRNITYNLHALGTNIEATLEEIADVAEWLIAYLRQEGEIRIFIDVRLTVRFDREQNIQEKILAVTHKLGATHG